MATYASATNPFIEISGARQTERLKKNAPGMAKPHRLASIGEQPAESAEAEGCEPKPKDDLHITKLDLIVCDWHEGATDDSSSPSRAGNSDGLDDDKCPFERKVAQSLGTTHDNNTDTRPLSLEAKKRLESSRLAALAELVLEECEKDIADTCRTLVENVAAEKLVPQERTSEQREQSNNIVHEQSQRVCFVESRIDHSSAESAPDKDRHIESEDESESELESIERASSAEQAGRRQHLELIKKLRLQLRDLERYAYERGELGKQVPDSVLAERQNLVIETLTEKLALNLGRDKIERLELNQLKEQVDKEIEELIDPLRNREHLLKQLKEQLTDLERYVEHLHESLGRPPIGATGLGSGRAPPTKSERGLRCICPAHGPLARAPDSKLPSSIMNNDSLPRTSRLVRALVAQLICSDVKIERSMDKWRSREQVAAEADSESECERGPRAEQQQQQQQQRRQHATKQQTVQPAAIAKTPQFHDGAIWTLHLDKIILATDSLLNLHSADDGQLQQQQALNQTSLNQSSRASLAPDESLVESVVRRQLVPALRDLLSYGLIDPSSMPRSNSYASFLFDPFYLLASLTCFPGFSSGDAANTNIPASRPSTQRANADSSGSSQFSQRVGANSSYQDAKIHPWHIIQDYYTSRSESDNFKSSSVKTLSQSFRLAPSLDGPIKVTSKQALLIAVDDVIEQMSKCKPNGPETHFKMFVYVALNRAKLATWLRIVFRNKSVLRKYYHNFSFANQPAKMERFLAIVDSLSKIKFNLAIDSDQSSSDQFVSAF